MPWGIVSKQNPKHTTMKKISLLLFAFAVYISALAQTTMLPTQERFFDDKAKILYRFHQAFPEGGDSTLCALFDVDRDGTPELFVKDKDGNKAMAWYSGNILRFEDLGYWMMGVTIWPRFVVSEGSAGTGVAVEYLIEMRKSRIINNVTITKEFRYEGEGDDMEASIEESYSEGYDDAKVKKIRSRIRRKNGAVTFNDLDWQPYVLE